MFPQFDAMKKLLTISLLVLPFISKAQSKIPDYGSISKSDIMMTECAFDKEADAVILLDHAVATPVDYNLVTVRRIRIKILKASALDRGNISIPYYNKDEFETLYDIKGYVHNLDENKVPYVTNLDKSSIFRKKINEYYSEVKLAMPEVRVGSIIEYQYESRMKSFAGLEEWRFQTDIPTAISHYDLTILPRLTFAYKISKSPNLVLDTKTIQDEGRVIFEMRDIAALRNEPYMDARDDYRQRVIFQISQYQSSDGVKQKYDNTWEDLGHDLSINESFGRQIEKNIGDADDFIKQVKALPTDYEKMTTVYNLIRKKFNWNGMSSKYASESLRKTWDKKSGNAGEINLLLINLLMEVGLNVSPVLVSERHHGKVNTTYPFKDQFNKVVAMVTIDNKKYFLDGTATDTPPNIIPFELINTTGFLVARKNSSLISLKDSTKSQKNYVGIVSTISEDGVLKGHATVSSYDYTRLDKLDFLSTHDQKEFTEKYLIKPVSDMIIDSLVINNKDKEDAPLEQLFNFTVSNPSSGDYYTIDVNLFNGLNRTPFVSDIRFTNINFGTEATSVVTQVIELPPGLKPETLPQNINLVMPDNSITMSRLMNYDAQTRKITVRIKTQIARPVFDSYEYPTVKDFYKKMVNILNEPLVLKRG